MCYSPITLREESKYDGRVHYRQVPCGKCLECLKSEQNQWQARLEEELHSWKGKAFFVTLTYAPENVPKNYLYHGKVYRSYPHYSYDNTDEQLGKRGGRVSRRQKPEQCIIDEECTPNVIVEMAWKKGKKYQELEDYVQDVLEIPEIDGAISFNSLRMEDVKFALDWFRRIAGRKIRAFIAGEYGTITERPHYHGLFFGEDKESLLPFMTFWQEHFGFVSWSQVESDGGSASYVSKYASKGSFGNFLCSKDFFYSHSDGTYKEYHSSNYEYCMRFFDINEPLVDKPKKLIPKSLGSGYLTPEKINYHMAKHDVDRIIKNKKYDFRNGKKQISLPKYYCEKIYSNYLKHKIQVALQDSQDSLFSSEYAFVETTHPVWLPDEIARQVFTNQAYREDAERRRNTASDTLSKFYRKSKF